MTFGNNQYLVLFCFLKSAPHWEAESAVAFTVGALA